MQAVLIVIQLIVSVALVGVVLLQKSEGGALGMGGGGSGLGGLFSPRGAADTLTRTTAFLAVLFFATSLGLTLLALHGRPQSVATIRHPVGTNLLLQPPKHGRPRRRATRFQRFRRRTSRLSFSICSRRAILRCGVNVSYFLRIALECGRSLRHVGLPWRG